MSETVTMILRRSPSEIQQEALEAHGRNAARRNAIRNAAKKARKRHKQTKRDGKNLADSWAAHLEHLANIQDMKEPFFPEPEEIVTSTYLPSCRRNL